MVIEIIYIGILTVLGFIAWRLYSRIKELRNELKSSKSKLISAYVKFGKSLYAATRPILVEVIQGLERGDEFAMKLVKLDAQAFANFMAQMTAERAEQGTLE